MAEPRRGDSSQPLHPLLADRWSGRAFDANVTVSDAQLQALFEAARWAASSGNLQPAYYLLGRRGERAFTRLFGLLRPKNQAWAHAAAALALGVARTADAGGRSIPYAEYDLGQASAQLALQAVEEGLMVHPMAGFDKARASEEFALTDELRPMVVIAIGVPGELSGLPEDLRQREIQQRRRRPLSETVFTDEWGTPAF